MRPVALAGILASTTMLGGCAATIGGVTLSSISSFAGFASTLFTGADLGEHAASLFTGKDCRFSEGLMRADRDICEEPGSAATRNDFHGIFVDRIDPDGTVIYAAPKYMSASVGAGEYDHNPDAIWKQIRAQKATEDGERQLARAQAAQSIDVAALATGSLSSQSLAFLPSGTTAESEIVDGDTASITATHPRLVANAASKKPAVHAAVQAPVVESAIDSSQPAIDEKSFTAPIQSAPARQTGEGGPFIAASTSSTPVASTLINGEPVVVLHIGPIFATSAEATNADTTSYEPVVQAMNDVAQPAVATPVAAPKPAGAPSPLAVLSLRPPPRAELPTASAPATAAVAEPQLTAARPRTKPAAVVAEVAAPVLTDAAKPKPARLAAHAPKVQADVYQPPSRTEAAYDPTAEAAGSTPVQVPGDIPAEHAMAPVADPKPAESSDTPGPATSGPAPLVPMPQP